MRSLTRELVAAHHRKADVEQGDVGHERPDDRERRGSVKRESNIVPEPRKRLGHELGRVAVVIDD